METKYFNCEFCGRKAELNNPETIIENNKLRKENQKLNDYLEQINDLMYNTLLLKNYIFNRADFTEKIMTILNNWAKETN